MFLTLFYILSGVFLGGALALLTSHFTALREVKRTERVAMFKLYIEILRKRQDASYQYSSETRRIIDAAHISQMSQWVSKCSHSHKEVPNSKCA
ncbi:MAG: hypothetical protein KAG20_09705 [Cocleimonas sp.]|nr:hypothetical protein [Cocleimonas sp.]